MSSAKQPVNTKMKLVPKGMFLDTPAERVLERINGVDRANQPCCQPLLASAIRGAKVQRARTGEETDGLSNEYIGWKMLIGEEA